VTLGATQGNMVAVTKGIGETTRSSQEISKRSVLVPWYGSRRRQRPVPDEDARIRDRTYVERGLCEHRITQPL
jgi:hypothetical protein